MLRIALKCHHTQSPHRLSHGVIQPAGGQTERPDVSDAKCRCVELVTPGPHGQYRFVFLPGGRESERVDGVEIPPNFSFARSRAVRTQRPRTVTGSLSCVAKKRSIGGDSAWRKKKRCESKEIYVGCCLPPSFPGGWCYSAGTVFTVGSPESPVSFFMNHHPGRGSCL